MLAPRCHLGPERLPVGEVIVDDLQGWDGALAEVGGCVGGRQCRYKVAVVGAALGPGLHLGLEQQQQQRGGGQGEQEQGQQVVPPHGAS